MFSGENVAFRCSGDGPEFPLFANKYFRRGRINLHLCDQVQHCVTKHESAMARVSSLKAFSDKYVKCGGWNTEGAPSLAVLFPMEAEVQEDKRM